jgi:hypothetical protein
MWSNLPGSSTYANKGDIEYLRLDENPAHSDFWVASPKGRLLLLRGYNSDSIKGYENFSEGEKFDVHLPVWRVSEALFHAQNLVKELGASVDKVKFNIRWTGLTQRSLYIDRGIMPRENLCKQDSVEVGSKVNIFEIESNLEEVLEDLTKDLYQAFNFFDPTEGLYEREAEKIIKKRN